MTKADIVVFSDFRHGMFNKTSIPELIGAIPKGAFQGRRLRIIDLQHRQVPFQRDHSRAGGSAS